MWGKNGEKEMKKLYWLQNYIIVSVLQNTFVVILYRVRFLSANTIH